MKTIFKLLPIICVLLSPFFQALIAMDEPFQCKVPIKNGQPKFNTQITSQQEEKKKQAELDAAQFAKEQESKRRSAIKNAKAKVGKEDAQLCKVTTNIKKLPAALQRYTCKFLDKKFNKVRSFRVHNQPILDLATHTKSNGDWYIITAALNGDVQKINGTTGEIIHTFKPFPQMSTAVATHAQSDGSWLILAGTEWGNVAIYDGDTLECIKVVPNVFGNAVAFLHRLATGTMNGIFYLFVYGIRKDPISTAIFKAIPINNKDLIAYGSDPEPVIENIKDNVRWIAAIRNQGWLGISSTADDERWNHMNQYQTELLNLQHLITSHFCANGTWNVIAQTYDRDLVIISSDKRIPVISINKPLPQEHDRSYHGLVTTYNKGDSWYIAVRSRDHNIKIYNGRTGKLEQTIPYFTNNPNFRMPITTHAQANGDVDLIITDDDGKITIFSEGPGEFEQHLTGNIIPDLKCEYVDENAAENNEIHNERQASNILSWLQKITLAGGFLGACMGLYKYLKR